MGVVLSENFLAACLLARGLNYDIELLSLPSQSANKPLMSCSLKKIVNVPKPCEHLPSQGGKLSKCLKKKLNASKPFPSIHSIRERETLSKRFDGNGIGCKDNSSSSVLNEFPNVRSTVRVNSIIR